MPLRSRPLNKLNSNGKRRNAAEQQRRAQALVEQRKGVQSSAEPKPGLMVENCRKIAIMFSYWVRFKI